MKKILLSFLILTFLCPALVFGQGLKSFTLKNGLTVYVWEDPSLTDVYGMVSVRAGSVDDPEGFTGLAHYLEHLMFKGTNRIGALDWEKERPIYETIIEKYDERAKTNDPIQLKRLDKEINELSAKQAAISQQTEFSSLVESIGGTDLNAGTSFDYTVYYNRFPKEQLERWLDLYSVRFMNPVFRTFQSELETVYEEFNMSEDNRGRQLQRFIFEKSFNGHPYSRAVIGLGEHLKNPQISKIVEFYNTWYTPQNMALILVGNLKTEEITAMVNRKFSRLPVAPDPVRKKMPIETIKGRKQLSGKVGQLPQTVLVFNGVPINHADEITLTVAVEMLSNQSRTGLLDKLSIDGDLMYIGAQQASFKDHGRIIVSAVPAFDYNQRIFESHKMVEKLITDQIKKLSNGEVDEWLLESVKSNIIRKHLRSMETSSGKANLISSAFVNGLGIDDVLNYEKLVQSVTIEKINKVVSEYLGNNFLALYIDEGKAPKSNKIEKPDYAEIPNPPINEKSLYVKWFEQIETGKSEYKKPDFNDISIRQINEKSKLYYYQNNTSPIFTLTLKYGVGSREMPKLSFAAQLMNNAGILAAYEPHEFKNALSQLNAELNYYCDDNYLYVEVEGYEDQLQLVCNLITRQILMPKLDSKQLGSLKGNALQSRRIEKENVQLQRLALMEYIRYKEKSDFIDRIPESDILNMSINDLTSVFQNATNYAAEVHYVGQMPFEKVHSILSSNLPLKANELDSKSPQVKANVKYNENRVFFLPNNDVTQSTIVFYGLGETFSVDQWYLMLAFNQYFSGGTEGIINYEIREKNSMAYTTYGYLENPQIKNEPLSFNGYIATQADKTIDAIDLYMRLVNDMPKTSSRINGLKDYIRLASLSRQPHFRSLSQEYERQKLLGFTEPSSNYIIRLVDQLNLDDMVSFYEKNLAGKPIAIGIVGNPKTVDMKQLGRFGKVERLSAGRIFK